MDSVQTAADRKTVCDNATAQQAQQTFIDEQAAAQQTAMQNHFSRRIVDWCDATNLDNPTSTEGTLVLPINNLVTSSVLDTWQSQLEGRGYTIARSGDSFEITLPA
jgi:hypothetical protein